MPIVQTTQTAGQATGVGLSWSQIKELANKRTDRRGEKTLDLDYELLAVLQDFCSEYPWFWRRITASVAAVAGQSVYDLNQPSLEIERIIRAYYVAGANDERQMCLISDTDAMMAMVEGSDTPSYPARFMREPGTPSSIRINPPDGAYNMRFLVWALPAMNTDAIGDAVPLVPGYLHHILVKGLEFSIFRYTIGEGAAKTVACKAEYERLVIKASSNRDGVAGIVREYTSGETAIASTGR